MRELQKSLNIRILFVLILTLVFNSWRTTVNDIVTNIMNQYKSKSTNSQNQI